MKLPFFPVKRRKLLAFSHDVAASAVAWCLAYWLRLNLDIPESYRHAMWQSLLLLLPLHVLIFWRFGLYRGIWRYASLPDLQRILIAVTAAAVSGPTLLVLLRMVDAVPRSVFLLHPLLLLLMMGGSRAAYRVWKERRLYGALRLQGEPVLLLGAGDAAVSLVKDLERSNEWRVIGLLDDDVAKQDMLLQGVRVLGRLEDLPRLAAQYSVNQAIIAMPAASHQARRHAMGLCAAAGVKAFTVPAFDDLVSGKVTISAIRRIELDDLLGRDPIVLDHSGLQGLIGGRVVMVTGAGGSIGAELCRQIARFQPRELVCFEQSEYALYLIEQEFSELRPQVKAAHVVGDIQNEARLDQVMAKHRPDVIFHAAAYKHVPLMEDDNAWEAVRNNALGTLLMAEAARRHGVGKFVFISTDKAVNPTNVMGATKRLAEMICQGLQDPGGTRFVMVRFGNVLGSNGSVIPKFREQIARGGPVTVTHPEITRYFMSIPEAAQLVLQAGLMGSAEKAGGEIFVLDMGEPVKIVDLARDMIRLSGFSEDEIRIVFTGLRPGEKLYEELLADGEQTLPTPHPKLRIARAQAVISPGGLAEMRAWLEGTPQDEQAVKQRLAQFVPEYRPQQTD